MGPSLKFVMAEVTGQLVALIPLFTSQVFVEDLLRAGRWMAWGGWEAEDYGLPGGAHRSWCLHTVVSKETMCWIIF